MKPVYQTKFGDIEGNCFSACIASILEIDIEEVPYFAFYDEAQYWLLERGYGMKSRGFKKEEPPEDEYIIMDGPSNRGHKRGHAVIMKNGELIHDPFPGGDGLWECKLWSLIYKL